MLVIDDHDTFKGKFGFVVIFVFQCHVVMDDISLNLSEQSPGLECHHQVIIFQSRSFDLDCQTVIGAEKFFHQCDIRFNGGQEWIIIDRLFFRLVKHVRQGLCLHSRGQRWFIGGRKQACCGEHLEGDDVLVGCKQ